MIPYAAYKVIHFLGIFTLLTTLASGGAHVLRGGSRADHPSRRLLASLHGVAAFFILLGGFGMLARLGVSHGSLPTWIWLKLAIWSLLSGALWLALRGAALARTLLVAAPLLAWLAALIALYKPF